MLDDALPPAYFAELARRLMTRRAELPVWCMENVCPASRKASAELGSLDRNEAQVAVQAAQETIRLAGELGGGLDGGALVLLRLGEVVGVRGLWAPARRAFLRDELEGSAMATRLLRERDAHAPRHVDAVRRSLDRLARHAESRGVRIGVRNPARIIGLPSPVELQALLEDLAGAPVVPVLDLPAAHLGDAMSLRPLGDTLDAWKSAPLALVADACGAVGGLAPGRGELDLERALSGLAATAHLVFTPSAILDEREIFEGTAALRALRR